MITALVSPSRSARVIRRMAWCFIPILLPRSSTRAFSFAPLAGRRCREAADEGRKNTTPHPAFGHPQRILCCSMSFWNGRDPFLKERFFGVIPTEANHGEDVKECYFYIDAVPSHAYQKMLYKYPQREYPYAQLIEENRRRGQHD